jgi:hypothetical protein
LVERRRGQIQAHPDADDHQVRALVGVLRAEGDLHQVGAGDQHREGDQAREARDRQDRDPDRGPEVLLVALRAEPGEVGEQAGLHCLEELQRSPSDHQHVEYVAGSGGAGSRIDEQRARVEKGLLAEHDEKHPGCEAAAARQAEFVRRRVDRRIPDGLGHRCAAAETTEEGEGHYEQRERRGRDDSKRDRRLPRGDPERHGRREGGSGDGFADDQQGVDGQAVAARQEAPREVARAVCRDRRDPDPVERGAAVQQVILDGRPERQRDDVEGDGDGELDRRRHPDGATDRRPVREVLRDGP